MRMLRHEPPVPLAQASAPLRACRRKELDPDLASNVGNLAKCAPDAPPEGKTYNQCTTKVLQVCNVRHILWSSEVNREHFDNAYKPMALGTEG
eukprot:m.1448339 g.1448339  ORF g.1448339 m.1448339 type:complete len:93 (+) comp25113_c0_seq2:1306-1584(+)